jgi:hypothetical protein
MILLTISILTIRVEKIISKFEQLASYTGAGVARLLFFPDILSLPFCLPLWGSWDGLRRIMSSVFLLMGFVMVSQGL